MSNSSDSEEEYQPEPPSPNASSSASDSEQEQSKDRQRKRKAGSEQKTSLAKRAKNVMAKKEVPKPVVENPAMQLVSRSLLDHIERTARDVALNTPLSRFHLPDPQDHDTENNTTTRQPQPVRARDRPRLEQRERARGKLMSLVEKGLDESALIATGVLLDEFVRHLMQPVLELRLHKQQAKQEQKVKKERKRQKKEHQAQG